MNTKFTGVIQKQILVQLIVVSMYKTNYLGGRKTHKIHDENFNASKIHWEFNWSNQWDQRLIKYIRDELLIPPPKYSKKNLNLVIPIPGKLKTPF